MDLLLESVSCPPDDDLTPTEESPESLDKELILNPPKRQISSHLSIASSSIVSPSWYAGLLTEEDFELVDPHRARFLRQLRDLANRKQAILGNMEIGEEERNNRLQALTLENPPCKLEDLR